MYPNSWRWGVNMRYRALRFSFMRWIAGVLLLVGSSTAFAGPWTEITTRDLDAIYKLIEENHPVSRYRTSLFQEMDG